MICDTLQYLFDDTSNMVTLLENCHKIFWDASIFDNIRLKTLQSVYKIIWMGNKMWKVELGDRNHIKPHCKIDVLHYSDAGLHFQTSSLARWDKSQLTFCGGLQKQAWLSWCRLNTGGISCKGHWAHFPSFLHPPSINPPCKDLYCFTSSPLFSCTSVTGTSPILMVYIGSEREVTWNGILF